MSHTIRANSSSARAFSSCPGHSVLVFCPSKGECEKVSMMIANHLGQVAEKAGTPGKAAAVSPAGAF
eukprot:1157271-Pelagomonas_calceolata.AAC.6